MVLKNEILYSYILYFTKQEERHQTQHDIANKSTLFYLN